MKVEYNYLSQQFENLEPYFEDLRKWVPTGEYTLGPYVEAFEKKAADYLGASHVISTNTGTDALILAFKAIDLKAGDEVITVANTFYATAGAIVAAGGKPVFVDCDNRYLIDVSQIESKITKKTKAIVPVHWTGAPADMKEIVSIARKYSLKVVEDACPSLGAQMDGKYCGTFGDIGCFSFHPLKQLNVWGDGGMVVTDNSEIADFLRLYRNHGLVDRDHIAMWGVNKRLQPFQAIIASRVLDTMEEALRLRVRNAARLDEGLKDLKSFVTLPPRPKNTREAFQVYMIRCQDRDRLLAHLIQEGIEAKVHYPIPLHLQKPAREMGYKEGDFPMAERQARELITLPAHQYVTLEQIHYTIEKIKEYYSHL